jgi:hypothetical protein
MRVFCGNALPWGDAIVLDRPKRERGAAMGTQRERAENQRRLKLEAVAQQVADGSLTIRQMTPDERKKYPKPLTPRTQRRRRA